MMEHAESDVIDPSLMTLNQCLESGTIAGSCARREVAIFLIRGGAIGEWVGDAHR